MVFFPKALIMAFVGCGGEAQEVGGVEPQEEVFFQ